MWLWPPGHVWGAASAWAPPVLTGAAALPSCSHIRTSALATPRAAPEPPRRVPPSHPAALGLPNVPVPLPLPLLRPSLIPSLGPGPSPSTRSPAEPPPRSVQRTRTRPAPHPTWSAEFAKPPRGPRASALTPDAAAHPRRLAQTTWPPWALPRHAQPRRTGSSCGSVSPSTGLAVLACATPGCAPLVPGGRRRRPAWRRGGAALWGCRSEPQARAAPRAASGTCESTGHGALPLVG